MDRDSLGRLGLIDPSAAGASVDSRPEAANAYENSDLSIDPGFNDLLDSTIDLIAFLIVHHYGSLAAPPDAIRNIPEAQITETQVLQNRRCPICLENFTLRERVKLLPCAHIYHKECIETWLNIHGTCPVCRQTLTGRNTSFLELRDEASGEDGSGGGAATAEGSSRTNLLSSTPSSPVRFFLKLYLYIQDLKFTVSQ